MSDNNILSGKEKLRALFESQEVMPANMQEFDERKQENEAFLQHDSIEQTKADIEKIDKFLTGEYQLDELNLDDELKLVLTDKDKLGLYNRKAMDLSHILLNSNSKKDSPEMTDVKVDILNLSKVVESLRDEPLTADAFDKVESAMLMAISSCDEYCKKKKPWTDKGIERKKMVSDAYYGIIMAKEYLAACRSYMEPGHEGEVPQTMGELFGMKWDKDHEIKRQESDKPNAKNAVPTMGERPLNKPSDNSMEVMRAFKPEYSFSGEIKKNAKDPKEIKKQADSVMKFYDTIKKFPKGRVEMADVEYMGKKVKLLQKSDGSTYIIDDHREYPLGKSLATLGNQIESDVFSNADVYGNTRILELLDRYTDPDYVRSITSGEHNRVRTMLISYLASKTKLVDNEFNNTYKDDLITYTKGLVRGTLQPEEVKSRVLEASQNGVFVNGVAVSEMVALNSKKSIDEIRALVEMNTTEEEEVIEKGWEEEEQHVKNMIADLIFTNNTEMMDLSVKNPAEYIREMLTKHKGAMAALIAAKDDEKDMVTTILNKMSIGDLNGTIDGHEVNLSEVVKHTINSLRDMVQEAGGGEISDEQLASVKSELDTVVDQSCKIMQGNVDVMTKVIFPEAGPQEEKKKTIRQLVKDSTKVDAGQGKFMRNVFKSYFGAASNIDKRCMLASVFRSAKIVHDDTRTDNDIARDLKESKDPKYRDFFNNTHKDDNDNKVYDLNEADLAQIREYREYNKKLRTQSNFMAGLIRGAGPLMHKMMQGLPVEGLPDEIKEAISDVKDNLVPIPDQIVQSEFLALVESSAGKVTKIERIKSLGAASVGQTFLCKIYGPSPELKKGKEVVIKILRPEAKNRMQREEKVMLDAAMATDKPMYMTYKGQLDNYKRELDLSIESKNCYAGVNNYTDKFADVKTMHVYDGIPATSTSLVLEKAEGTTMKSYIDEVNSFTDETLDELYVKMEMKDGSIKTSKEITYNCDEALEQKFFEKKKLLVDKIEEAIKRRDHLINLCNIWIDEAVMNREGGFYHGDLHAGNIMINDKDATFIDFGNTVQLTPAQQMNIARMMVAAAGSIFNKASNHGVDLFFEGFNELIKDNNDPEFLAMYTEEKKAQLKTEFKKILDMGDEHEAGYRINYCLTKAQELGIKIPPAIQNFSQGQIRLQNSIDELNRAIGKMKEGIKKLDEPHISLAYRDADPVMIVRNKIKQTITNDTPKEQYNRFMGTLLPVNKDDFTAMLMDNRIIEQDLENGIQGGDKHDEFAAKYTNGYARLFTMAENEFYKLGMSVEDVKKYSDQIGKKEYKNFKLSIPEGTKTYRQMMQEFFDTWKDKKGSPEHIKATNKMCYSMIPNSGDECLSEFGGFVAISEQLRNALRILDWSDCEKILDIFENKIPKAMAMIKDIDTLWNDQRAKKSKMSEAQQTALADKIYTDYNELHVSNKMQSPVISTISGYLDVPYYEQSMEAELPIMFSIEKDGIGARLREKFEAYKTLKTRYPVIKNGRSNDWKIGPEDEVAYKTVKEEFLEVYAEAAIVRLQDFGSKMFEKDPNVKMVDFDKVLRDIMTKRLNLNGSWASKSLAIGKMIGWLGNTSMPLLWDMK